MAEYQGVELPEAEAAAMEELERELGEPIPKVDKVWHDTFGFTAAGGHVTGLGLYRKGLTSFPEIITKLTWLKELGLAENNLSSLPDSIGNLASIEVLNLDKNPITSLPWSALGEMKSLRAISGDDSNFLPSYNRLKKLYRFLWAMKTTRRTSSLR